MINSKDQKALSEAIAAWAERQNAEEKSESTLKAIHNELSDIRLRLIKLEYPDFKP